MADKVHYATRALAAVAAVRGASGLPHWLLVDEAHHLAPAEGSSAAELLEVSGESLVLITLSAGHLAREARRAITVVASTDHAAFRSALDTLRADGLAVRPWTDGDRRPLARGEALLARLGDGAPGSLRFRVAAREVDHRRHVRKYAEGELPPDRSFFFRGPAAALNLRAANLKRFCELAEGVDDGTWMWHLRRGDYSAWIRRDIKDAELADEVAAAERDGAEAGASRRQVLDAVRRRYAV
jgi:hypothetical protein